MAFAKSGFPAFLIVLRRFSNDVGGNFISGGNFCLKGFRRLFLPEVLLGIGATLGMDS